MRDVPFDPAFASVAELATAYDSGALAPIDLVERQLARINELDPLLRAFTSLRADGARADALRLGEELRAKRRRSPLHGVTVAFKDQMDVAGLPLTGGSRVLPGEIAERDATVVARLRDAGAIVLGMLNTHEFHAGPTRVFPFGTPRNPWSLSHAPGGSSSGSASAVAAGLSTLSLGGDTGGSIRGPASMCGIVGLKPTWSRLSRAGIIPLAPSLDVVGPLARRVADAELALQAMIGRDPRDPTASARGYAPSDDASVAGMRIAAIDEFFDPATLDGAAIDAAETALATLTALGAHVSRISIPSLRHAQELMWVLVMAEAIGTHRDWLRERADAYDVNTRTRLLAGAIMPAGLVASATRMRARIAREIRAALADVDLLASPTGASAPRLEGAPLATVPGGTAPAAPTYQAFNLSGHPALTVPCGLDPEGLPLGLQLVAHPFAEARAFAVARAYEAVAPWHAQRPGVDGRGPTFRRARSDDYPRVAAWASNLTELVLWTGPRYTMDDLRDLPTFFDLARAESWVLDEGGRAIAFGQLIARGAERIHLVRIITDPAERRAGHAGALVTRLLERARARGAAVASLNVRPDNAAAARLYERLGFRPAQRPSEDPPLVSTYYEFPLRRSARASA
jgi:aspartyl-tRNA(Asn)/glutamyl-tRNA(Gln) amidotransferase subunit A